MVSRPVDRIASINIERIKEAACRFYFLNAGFVLFYRSPIVQEDYERLENSAY
jgi:hypothetical protein